MTGNMIGRVFNSRYTLTERIGLGGMAEVYLAQDNTLGRIVAVKVMLPQYAEDPDFTRRFKQEAAASANLQSPYIVNVYDWGQDQGTYFLVMEYVRGSDLKTAINERGAINQRKVAEIGTQVCQALSVAHKLDIMHRDIKPQNIMIQPDGNVKVMDFGIARAKNSVMTQTSSVLGTAHYISPEQAQGKELTYASDIYSLGVVLYEAATGSLPFDGPDSISVAMMQVNDLPQAPREINPDIDPGLESIILKALAKNPSERFATANDMKTVLNDYLLGRPINLEGFSGAETAMLGAGAAGAAAGMGSGTSVMPVVPADTSTTNATTQYKADNPKKKAAANKKRRNIIIVGVLVALLAVAGIAFALTTGGGDTAVPDVVGKSETDARRLIEQAGFEVGQVNQVFDADIESGRVVSTDPEAGEKLEKGSKINLNVSKGTEPVEVPDLRGMKASEARAALEKAGLKAEAGDPEYSDTVEKELIIRQTPEPGSTVSKGDTVTYIRSLGSENVSVPSVVGMSESEARSTLQNAGFSVSSSEDYNDEYNAGVVYGQNPSSGVKVEKGASVTIYVSAGKAPLIVPYVVGQPLASAQSTLESMGLKVSVKEKYSSTESSGTVMEQNPASGSEAKSGATVTLTVSKGPDPKDEKTS